MQYVNLANNVQMPILGFGVFQISPEETEQAVIHAIQAGYRHIDTAQSYMNETEIGRGIAKSGVAREELFITTKVWISNYEDAKASVERSLARMGLDYLDLVLLHQPFGDTFKAWKDLEELQAAGKVRAIGVSNFSPSFAVELGAFHKVMPQVNQIEVNPFFQRPEEIAKLQAQGIAVQAWAPFAEGKNEIFSNSVLVEIGKKYGKSVAQVIVRWLVEQNITVLAKSVKPERMAENINVFDFALSDEDKAQIATLDLGKTIIFDHSDPEIVKFLAGYKVNA
ncbi:2,5-diketo-D-gluconic acid reductase [Pasteurellaceae bacterium RH1A]|nr:2,5-diketo-D-gluconic acid reductase [Pasteurellaceae bacterium RH1A]